MRRSSLGRDFLTAVRPLVGIAVLLAFSGDSRALPLFARKYEQPCTRCHTPLPKLNDFGNMFRDNGYQMKGLEGALAKVAAMQKGVAPPEDISERDVPTSLSTAFWPVSLRGTIGYGYRTFNGVPMKNGPDPAELGRASTSRVELIGIRLLTGGTLARNVTHLLTFRGLEGGAIRPEQVWFRLDNLAGSLASLKVGQMELDVPLSPARTPTFFRAHAAYSYKPGTPYLKTIGDPLSGAPLPFDTKSPYEYGNIATFDLGQPKSGIELEGHTAVAPGYVFRYALTGIVTDQIGSGTIAPGLYAHVTQSFGGYGISSGTRIGAHGVVAQAPTSNPTGVPGAGGQDIPFYRAGGELSTGFMLPGVGLVTFHGVYTYGLDKSSLMTIRPAAQEARWHSTTAELNWAKLPNMLILRYDAVRNEQQGSDQVPKDFNDVDVGTVGYRRLMFDPIVSVTLLRLDYVIMRTKKTAPNGGDQVVHQFFGGAGVVF
ncbi:MAG: hypothetical protein HYZ28_12560 [Myxococcales bacterium]|nr:hypothetical protein [Myxococcales bacterium]